MMYCNESYDEDNDASGTGDADDNAADSSGANDDEDDVAVDQARNEFSIKMIEQLDIVTGEVLQRYRSQTEAGVAMQVTSEFTQPHTNNSPFLSSILIL